MTATMSAISLPTKMIIGDQRLELASGGEFEHVNPATALVQASLPSGGAAEVDRAVASAKAALIEWGTWAPSARRRVLFRLADLIAAHRDELAGILAREG